MLTQPGCDLAPENGTSGRMRSAMVRIEATGAPHKLRGCGDGSWES